MQTTVKHEIHMVTDPEPLSLDEIKAKYWDNYVLVTNTSEGNLAGVVRYYCYANEPELTEIIMELDKDEAEYGDCLLYYVGPGRGFVGVYL